MTRLEEFAKANLCSSQHCKDPETCIEKGACSKYDEFCSALDELIKYYVNDKLTEKERGIERDELGWIK